MDYKIKEVRKVIIFAVFIFFFTALLKFESSLSIFFYSWIESLVAKYEATTGKVHFIHKVVNGNCRIVNLNEVLNSKGRLCVVMGELIENGKKYYHLWATSNCENPFLKEYYIDKTKKNIKEIKSSIYIPMVVLFMNNKCNLYIVWSSLDNIPSSSRLIYRKFFSYITTFCEVKRGLRR